RQFLAEAMIISLGGGAIGFACALVARHFGAQDLGVGETNGLRLRTLRETGGFSAYAPGTPDEPAENSVDLVIDAVGAAATRAAASRLVRPGGVIVHLGLLPGLDGLDVRKVTLQEVTFLGSYCYTARDFGEVVQALAARQLGSLAWFAQRDLADGARAFHDIDANQIAAAKVVLRT
ncbi:MAG TPA: zinc-binding dehydrogenase, partial [Beijerinckiaceae bacterium]|nr:zinc-binding dehydrogenase [Beijerinckiaceae bacterium]